MISAEQTKSVTNNHLLDGLFSQKPETGRAEDPLLSQTKKWRDALLRTIFTMPMRYADRSDILNTPEFEENLKVHVHGTVQSKKTVHGKKGPFLEVHLVDALGHEFQILWFHFRAHQEKMLQPGKQHIFAGKPKRRNRVWTLFNPEILTNADMGEIEPIYRKEGPENSEQIKKRVRLLIKESGPFIPKLFPDNLDAILQLMELPALPEALRDTHWPYDLETAYRAQESIKVAEMVWQMAALAHPSNGRMTAIRPALSVTPEQQSRLLQALPFTLSQSQEKAWAGMCQCLGQTRAQDILILGGVGSGKSALAFLASIAQASSTHEPCHALLIAPTVILARQLYENLLGIVTSMGLEVGLYGRDKYQQGTGALSHARLWVGTHGLLTAVPDWDRVGLVVMDEEHRYGKNVKDLPPHVHRILMSATPIPNTLAQQRFGSMHLFRLLNDHHKRVVRSMVLPRHTPHTAIEQIQKTLLRQRKGLVVYAAVQENETFALPDHFYFLHQQIQGDQAILVDTKKLHPVCTPKEAIETGKLARILFPHCEQLLRDNSQDIHRFYRLNKDFSAKKIIDAEPQMDLLAMDILLYDKDQPDRFFLAPMPWLRKGKSGAMTTKAILNACRNDALDSIPILRGSQILRGKSLESSRTYWEDKFPGQTAFLHGKMTHSEKAAALEGFRSGTTPLLVASNIVEVGIDVPGAETVVVADADRMGVASLVQIRGRVGRHGEPGYCFFLGSSRDKEGMERLERIAREDNDEKLAIQDFLERGYGNAGQMAQSGNTARLFRLPRDARLFLKVAQLTSSLDLKNEI